MVVQKEIVETLVTEVFLKIKHPNVNLHFLMAYESSFASVFHLFILMLNLSLPFLF